MAVGIPLGILVGIVSGAAFVVFLRTAFLENKLKAAGSMLSMPTSWFAGGWLTEVFDVDEVLSSYVTTLAISVVVIAAYPLLMVVVRVGNEVRKAS